MINAFGIDDEISKARRRRNVMPKQYRKAEARKAGQRFRFKATGHHVGPNPPKPALWKRPGFQLAGAAVIGGAVAGTAYGYKKQRDQQALMPQPMPVNVVNKSYATVGGKVVNMTPKAMRAQGLKPASHAGMKGPTKQDAEYRDDMQSFINQIRPHMGKKKMKFDEGQLDAAYKATTRGKRKVFGTTYSEGGHLAGFAIPVPKRGAGQREARWLTGQDKETGKVADYARHEYEHTKHKRPLSAFYRLKTRPKSLWAEEARSDSAMVDDSRSGYKFAANDKGQTGKEMRRHLADTPMGADPKNLKRYRTVQRKIKAAKGNAPKPDIPTYWYKSGKNKTIKDLNERRDTFVTDSKGTSERVVRRFG